MKNTTGAALGAAALLLGATTALTGVVGATTAGASTDGARSARGGYEPAGHTIVEVTGDKANGFEIYRYDGTEQFPPTDSEARAECREYDTQVARVRCRTEVRVWYRDLGELKQALAYAQQDG